MNICGSKLFSEKQNFFGHVLKPLHTKIRTNERSGNSLKIGKNERIRKTGSCSYSTRSHGEKHEHVPIYLKDYIPPSFQIESIHLEFHLEKVCFIC